VDDPIAALFAAAEVAGVGGVADADERAGVATGSPFFKWNIRSETAPIEHTAVMTAA
jgi:hypothetical protein